MRAHICGRHSHPSSGMCGVSNDQNPPTIMLLEESWHLISFKAACIVDGGIVCHQHYFFIFFLFSPLDFRVGYAKFQIYPLIS